MFYSMLNIILLGLIVSLPHLNIKGEYIEKEKEVKVVNLKKIENNIEIKYKGDIIFTTKER